MYAIFGCGGFGKQIARMLKTADPDYPLAFVSERLEPPQVLGIPVFNATDFFNNWQSLGFKHFNIAIQNSAARERLANKCVKTGLKPFNITPKENYIDYGHNSVGSGAILCDFVSVMPTAKIGAYFHCNHFCYIGHDCVLGDFVTLTHHIGLNGGVKVGNHAFIGTGAQIKNGVEIGAYSIVGMGAIVTRDVPPHSTVVGNPARIVKSTQRARVLHG